MRASRGWPTNCTVIWFRRWRTNAQDWPLPDLAAPYECALLDAQGQKRAGSPLITANFSMPPKGEGRVLGFAVFPPVRGQQTIRIQRNNPGVRGKDQLVATNPPVEFVVEVP